MKRSPHIQPFSHDHYQGLHFARRLRAAGEAGADGEAIASYIGQVWDEHLTEHFDQEEALLVEPLRDTDGGDLADRMMAEHLDIRERIDRLRQDASEPAGVRALADTCQAHIRFEDRELFPHLEENLEPSRLEALGRRLQEIHGGTDVMWPTPAWE